MHVVTPPRGLGAQHTQPVLLHDPPAGVVDAEHGGSSSGARAEDHGGTCGGDAAAELKEKELETEGKEDTEEPEAERDGLSGGDGVGERDGEGWRVWRVRIVSVLVLIDPASIARGGGPQSCYRTFKLYPSDTEAVVNHRWRFLPEFNILSSSHGPWLDNKIFLESWSSPNLRYFGLGQGGSPISDSTPPPAATIQCLLATRARSIIQVVYAVEIQSAATRDFIDANSVPFSFSIVQPRKFQQR
ncbi:hypothetical protein B0H13DRAFT_1908211 [Mycena leptocephala]|nr:hypothetical protein B0H13DRAFT_1908211 [Mycena leptocephala]